MAPASASPDIRPPAHTDVVVDLAELTHRLSRALPTEGRTGPFEWRRAHAGLIAAVTRALARGDLDAPGEQHRRMHVFLPYLQDHLRAEGEPGEAARALRDLIALLEVQAHALEVPRLEQALRQPTALQRSVLGVLLAATEAMSCTGVWGRLPAPPVREARPGRPALPEGWSREAVYQSLEQLVVLGLVVRSDVRVNGRRVAHYHLWDTGRELCEKVGIAPLVVVPVRPPTAGSPHPPPRRAGDVYSETAAWSTRPDVSPPERKVAALALANSARESAAQPERSRPLVVGP